MPPTEVNKLERELEQARNAHSRLVSRLFGPRWRRGGQRAMVFGDAARKLEANITEAVEKLENAESKFSAALNRNANSLQAQHRALERQYQALRANWYAARGKLENLNAQARAANRSGNANAKARIERNKIPHKIVLARFKREKNAIEAQERNIRAAQRNLETALGRRRRVLNRSMTPEAARRIIGKFLSRTIVARTTHGPYGTRTLATMRQFPGYEDPTLENYATARREINRLRTRLIRKRSPNRSPNRSPKSQRK